MAVVNKTNSDTMSRPEHRSRGCRCLFVLPTGYSDYRHVRDSFEAADVPALYRFHVTGEATEVAQGELFGSAGAKTKMTILPVASTDGIPAQVRLYGGVYALGSARNQESFLGYAKILSTRDGLMCMNPSIVECGLVGKVVPTYRKLDQRDSSAQWREVLDTLASPDIIERVGDQVASQIGLPFDELLSRVGFRFGAGAFLRALHTPISPEQGADALSWSKTIGTHALLYASQKASANEGSKSAVLTMKGMEALHERVDVRLTADQLTAIREIGAFITTACTRRMVLSGDVGTGKTLSYLIPAIAVAQAGHRVAVLLPNSLLVASVIDQTARLGAKIEAHSFTAAKKATTKGECTSADGCIHVGTTALISSGQTYDLVIVDEMQKFSVAQRQALLRPGGKLIESTATCVPRSQALISFAGTPVSRLKERPFIRQVTTQMLCGADGRSELSRRIHETISTGNQAAVVYSLRSKKGERRSAEEAHAELEKRFPLRVGLLHGAMSEADKQTVIDRMTANELSLLVCTTVLELGITLPSLSLLAVINPERFGLTTLHQLRGRVGRHGGEGRFVLYHEHYPEGDAAFRSKVLCRVDDGFVVADEDLRLRGMGDLLQGGEQAGKSRLLFENLSVTIDDVLEAASRPNHKPAPEREVAMFATSGILD